MRAFSPYGLSKGLTRELCQYYCEREGMPLDRFVAENVTGPLAMADTGYFVPEQNWNRIAQPIIDPATGQLPNHQDARKETKLKCGNTGMVATAADYLRFAQMMLNGGALGDVRVLGAGTVAHMRSDHLGAISRDGEKSGCELRRRGARTGSGAQLEIWQPEFQRHAFGGELLLLQSKRDFFAKRE